jgi:hypothetical protein
VNQSDINLSGNIQLIVAMTGKGREGLRKRATRSMIGNHIDLTGDTVGG